MLYVQAVPRWLCSAVLAGGTDTVTPAHLLVMRLPLLACDVVLAALLASWFPRRRRLVLLVYWCSPLAFYITYWHGQLDVIPTALLLLSLFLLRHKQDLEAAAVLGLGLGCKTHLLVAVPFLASTQLLWFRRSIALRSGVDPARTAVTWEQPGYGLGLRPGHRVRR
jgi:Gpi18-like mannosyltransferase